MGVKIFQVSNGSKKNIVVKSRSNFINVLFLFGVGAFDEFAMIPTTKTLKSETK